MHQIAGHNSIDKALLRLKQECTSRICVVMRFAVSKMNMFFVSLVHAQRAIAKIAGFCPKTHVLNLVPYSGGQCAFIVTIVLRHVSPTRFANGFVSDYWLRHMQARKPSLNSTNQIRLQPDYLLNFSMFECFG